MNLTEWAETQGTHKTTAYRWYRDGVLPVPARKVGRLILVNPEAAPSAAGTRAGLYARVSSHDQKAGRGRQAARLAAWAAARNMTVVKVVTEVGSGMNGARPKARRSARNRARKALACAAQDPGGGR